MKHASYPQTVAYDSKYAHVYQIRLDSVLIKNLLKDARTKIQGFIKILKSMLKTHRSTKTCKVFIFNSSLYVLVITEHKDKRKKGYEIIFDKCSFGECIFVANTTWSMRINGEMVFEVSNPAAHFAQLKWPNTFRPDLPLFVGPNILFFEKNNVNKKFDLTSLQKGLSDINTLANDMFMIKQYMENEHTETKMHMRENEVKRLRNEKDALLFRCKHDVEENEKLKKMVKKVQEDNRTLRDNVSNWIQTNAESRNEIIVHKTRADDLQIRVQKQSVKELQAKNKLANAFKTISNKDNEITKLQRKLGEKRTEIDKMQGKIEKICKEKGELKVTLRKEEEERALLSTAWKRISDKAVGKFYNLLTAVFPAYNLEKMEELLGDIKTLYEQSYNKEDLFMVYRHIQLSKTSKETCCDYVERLEDEIFQVKEKFKQYKDKHIQDTVVILKQHRRLRMFCARNLIFAYAYEAVLQNALTRFHDHKKELSVFIDTMSKKITKDTRFFKKNEDTFCDDVTTVCHLYGTHVASYYLFRQTLHLEGHFDFRRTHLWQMKNGEIMFMRLREALEGVHGTEEETIERYEDELNLDIDRRRYNKNRNSPVGHTLYSWGKTLQPATPDGHTSFSWSNTSRDKKNAFMFYAYQLLPKKKDGLQVEQQTFLYSTKPISLRQMRIKINEKLKVGIANPIVFFHAEIIDKKVGIQQVLFEDGYLEDLTKPLYFYACALK